MRFAVLCGLLCAVATPAGATLFQVTGTFGADGFAGTQQAPPVDIVTGSFEFIYDDTTPPGPPVSITPTTAFSQVGSAIFDETNTEVRLFFDDFGRFVQIWWGGLAGGSANQIEDGVDDIAVAYQVNGSGVPFNVSYALDGTEGSFRGLRSGRTGSLVFTVIPEPSTALLVGLGLAGLAGRRRARSA